MRIRSLGTKTLLILTVLAYTPLAAGDELLPLERLGESLFADTALSIGRNQSCASCHSLDWGGTGPDPGINQGGAVLQGSIHGRFGNRKPPSFSYATLSPVLFQDGSDWTGGLFWDGRATGDRLGDPAAEQAQVPLINPAEQALPSAACVVYRVANSGYATLYEQVWGDSIFSIVFPPDSDTLCESEGISLDLLDEDRDKVEVEYDNIAISLAAYESSSEVNRYSSKYDAWRNGRAKLNRNERIGRILFLNSMCHKCHTLGGDNAALTNFQYANIGVPPNPENPALQADPDYVDLGLGGFLKSRGEPAAVYQPEIGKMKIPTLRNVGKKPSPTATKAYMHNGVFKSLKEVVHFYNTRDVLPHCETLPDPEFGVNCWPVPEVAENMHTQFIGNLRLTDQRENQIVDFLKALSDE